MSERKRKIPIMVMVNEHEKQLIQKKMHQLGTKNMGAYIRKMAIDGYVVRLDLSDLNEMVRLLRYTSNNINQYTKRAHETGRIHTADINDMRNSLNGLWKTTNQILTRLATLD